MTTTVALLDAIRAHLTDFELPELYSINITKSLSGPSVTAQLACHTPPQIAGALLAWADTLTDVTTQAWRVPSGTEVHLSVIGRLPGGASVAVYGGVAFTDHSIGRDLAPDASTTVPLGGWCQTAHLHEKWATESVKSQVRTLRFGHYR